MILVLIVSWVRFFSYFLVINIIAKLTITLLKMLADTLNFIIIVVCYFMLATTIFTTLFRNANTDAGDDFKSLSSTFLALFSLSTGNYNPVDMGNYNTSYNILYILHIIISSIFLMNYLIAILQTVY